MNEWKRKEKETQNQRGYHSRYNKMDNEPAFFNGISEQSQQRAFWILDALFCAVEELGGKVNADFSMRVMTDTVRIRIAEGQDKVKHELARQEARELVEYNDQIKRNNWASKPQIRKRKEEEVRRTKELLNQAEDYKIACEIRQYIAAVTQQKDITPEAAEWIEWAKKKADWYDPIIAAEDEYLGRRARSKSKEEKDLDKINRGRYGILGW